MILKMEIIRGLTTLFKHCIKIYKHCVKIIINLVLLVLSNVDEALSSNYPNHIKTMLYKLP